VACFLKWSLISCGTNLVPLPPGPSVLPPAFSASRPASVHCTFQGEAYPSARAACPAAPAALCSPWGRCCLALGHGTQGRLLPAQHPEKKRTVGIGVLVFSLRVEDFFKRASWTQRWLSAMHGAGTECPQGDTRVPDSQTKHVDSGKLLTLLRGEGCCPSSLPGDV
jgi:hypothetical protein